MPKWDGSSPQAVDVENLLDATTLEYLQLLVASGALVSIGTSRDGGALSVHVKAGDVKNRDWFRSDEDLHEWLAEGCRALSIARSEGPSNVKALRGS